MGTNEFKNGWASGTMECKQCGQKYEHIRFRYSCYDIVEGDWPKCCDQVTSFYNDWKPEVTKTKISIPVVVTKSGAIRSGIYSCEPYAKNEYTDVQFCYDSLEDKDFDSGTTVIHVDVEIDFDLLFKEHTILGIVKQDGGT